MTKIRKFSLAYDAGEDRIAWDAEDVDGGVTRIWLTQRFCRQFVGALIPRLQNAGSELAPEHQAAVQGWEQAAAMSGFGKTPGVRATASATTGLVRAIHITPTRVGLSLAFEFGASETRAIDLDLAAVRQMLSVLYKLQLAAHWPTDFWPTWITAEPAAPATSLN